MGFWSWFTGVTPNDTIGDPPTVGASAVNPGDPDGLVFEGEDTFSGQRAAIIPSPWDGWPAEWAPPNWDRGKFEDLVDTAWAALDLNASVLSAMPVYRTRNGRVKEPTSWMMNPDPMIYASWAEFAKQLFWDYQGLGEAFVLPMARGADGLPRNFRTIPPWLMNVEMDGGTRSYKLGSLDVTNDVLHIRYKSTTDGARGIGPLESGRHRLIASGVLARYAAELAGGGGVPQYVLEVEDRLTPAQAGELMDQWWQSRLASRGEKWKPAVLTGGVKANPLQLSPQDMALLDLTQFNEARIVNLLGVPPFLMGLPSGGGSITYTNANTLFDFHDRRYLKTAATHVMSALSGWALPRGQSVELNRDEYSRPPLKERAEAYAVLHAIQDESGRPITAEEIRTMERLEGSESAEALTGGGRS